MAKPDLITRYHRARLVSLNRENFPYYQHISYFLEIPWIYTHGDPRVPYGKYTREGP